MSLTKALRLSNNAVMLLLAGDCHCSQEKVEETTMDIDDRDDQFFEAAISAFSSSLQEIKLLLSNPNITQEAAMTSCDTIDVESCSLSSHQIMSDDVSPKNHDQDMLQFISYSFQSLPQLDDGNESSSYIYNNMLLFHLFQDDDESEEWGNSSLYQSRAMRTTPSFLSLNDVIHIYSSFIMLNIALTYHQKAFQLPIGKQQSMFFRQAEQMYEIVAQKMHSKASIINKAMSTDLGTIAILLKAAAVNNLSQLQFRRCDYTESYKGFQFLGSLILNAVVDSTTDGFPLQKTRTMTKEDENIYRHMLLNVYFLYPPRFAAAA